MNRWWSLSLSEPYRIFFPLALLSGCLGVLLWPFFHWHLISDSPLVSHPRIMIGSMMSGFILGFLGTAAHRLTSSPPWSRPAWLALLLLWLLTLTCYASQHIAQGDASLCALLSLLTLGLVLRLTRLRQSLPPPGFLLVLISLCATIAATAFLASRPDPGSFAHRLALLQLYQGFTLLPILGIAPYLLPRFFNHPSTHALPPTNSPTGTWALLACKSLACGTLILSSFWLELRGDQLAAYCLRAATCLCWFTLETPFLRHNRSANTPANACRIAIISIVIGLATAGISTPWRIGFLHLTLISGFGLLTLTAATRVILGHANRHDLLNGKIRWLRWVVGLAILTALTRTTCDLIPKVSISHQIYAALTWALLSIIWLAALGKWFPRKDKAPLNRCPRRLPQIPSFSLTPGSPSAIRPIPPIGDTTD